MSEGDVTFLQFRLPPLESGDFTLSVRQTVTVGGATQETLTAEQRFTVAGLRYSLGPDAVNSVFPPNGHTGEFSNVLPHVVLTEPTLPWQRLPGGPHGSERASWLGLLLFTSADPPPVPRAVTLADLAPSKGVFFPPRESETGETPADPVTVIDVPPCVFSAIAPAAADLDWLAHVRELPSSSQKASPPGAAAATDYAVVFGNRLPPRGASCSAHLVSLEGFGDYLPNADGTPSTRLPKDATAIRLVTLHQWSFTAEDEPQTFTEMMAGVGTAPTTLQLAPPRPPADAAVANALGLGYVPLEHVLRNGDATVSWYRGPLLPVKAAPGVELPAVAPDALIAFDPTTGMFDVAYATAWQVGRLLALRDGAFATALYRWKHRLAADAVASLGRQIVEQDLTVGDDGTLASTLRAVVAAAANGAGEDGE